MNYKNDVSFVFDFFLNLYEHQSTFNRNMPLRDLIYVTKVIQGIIREGILSDFLKKHRAEAIEMSIFEYDEEKHLKSEREIWKQAGIEEGIERGIVTGKAEEIVETGQEFGLSEPDILKRLETRLAISAEQAKAYLVEFGKDKKLS